MSEKDLIRRGDVRKLADWLETEDGEILVVDMDDVDDIPAVPREMSAREYLAAEQRMCFDENIGKRNCVNCPLSALINPARINCGDYSRVHPDKAVAAVEKWAREHTEMSEE